jgi:hypothetical protein
MTCRSGDKNSSIYESKLSQRQAKMVRALKVDRSYYNQSVTLIYIIQ